MTINIESYNQFDALIFDMDGTLIDSVDRHDRIWKQVLDRFEIPFTAQRMVALGGVPSVATVEILTKEAGIERDCVEVAMAKEQAFAQMGFDGLQLTPLIDVVRYYHGKKPMAIGTGAGSAEAHAILSHFDILQLFDSVVCADMVAAPKPSPDTFLQCALDMQTPATHCVVFEDADGGLQAAAAVGMAAVDVRPLWTVERLFR